MERIKREGEDRLRLVYAAAVANRAAYHAKKMPKFDDLFGRKRSGAQTPEEIMAVFKEWTDVVSAAQKRRPN